MATPETLAGSVTAILECFDCDTLHHGTQSHTDTRGASVYNVEGECQTNDFLTIEVMVSVTCNDALCGTCYPGALTNYLFG